MGNVILVDSGRRVHQSETAIELRKSRNCTYDHGKKRSVVKNWIAPDEREEKW